MIKEKPRNESLSEFTNISNYVGNRSDYVQGGGGNTSVKLDKKYMAIKASGYFIKDIRPDYGYSLVNYSEIEKFIKENKVSNFNDLEKTGKDFINEQIVDIKGMGRLRPSVETGFHSILKKFVIHSHSVYSNLINCMENGRAYFIENFPMLSDRVCFIPYTNPGFELSFKIEDSVSEFKRANGALPDYLFLQNHGLIVHSDKAEESISLHEDINRRLAKHFNANSYPEPEVIKIDENLYCSSTKWLKDLWNENMIDSEFLSNTALFPDQLVYVNQSLSDAKNPGKNQIAIDKHKKAILYRCDEKRAFAMEETLVSVYFIYSTLKKCGKQIQNMGHSSKDFINNWESEKYRKKLL